MSATGELAGTARAALADLYVRLATMGCAAPHDTAGQLIRPVLSLAGAEALGIEPADDVWAAIAAVQLAHEASLMHDDVIDGAAIRRGEPTAVASRGIAAALVEGDHLLTTAYRVASATGSIAFMKTFAHAVERTVAGEKLQGRAAGVVMDERGYRGIVGMKSGELLGCALAAPALVRDAPIASELYVLGRRIGILYQMLDDLLDYCPDTDTGKLPLGDYRQQRWTWPLMELPGAGFDMHAEDVAELLALRGGATTAPLERCLHKFEAEAALLRGAAATHMPHDRAVTALITDWTARAAAAVSRAVVMSAERRTRAELDARLAGTADAGRFFRNNSRSFSLAATLFPAVFRARVAKLYAFCRVTDDLADAAGDCSSGQQALRLDLWERQARAAYDGGVTGVALLDGVMTDAASAGVPFSYVAALFEGMRMDMRGGRYETLDELRVYSYRVAGVIGQWLARMCGVDDAWVLGRAATLGHALQLTNILRDVGEDARAGRIYIPAAVLAAHGLDADRVFDAAERGELPPGWPAMVEQLMTHADRDYVTALAAVGELPPYFRRAVVAAAHIYRGIHDEIRASGYDNLTRRAHTTTATKLRLAVRGLMGAPLLTGTSAHGKPGAVPPAVGRPPVRHRAAGATGAAVMLALIAATAQAAGPADATPGAQADACTGASTIAEFIGESAQAVPPAGAAVRAPAISPAAHVERLEQALAADPRNAAVALDLARALFFAAVDDRRARSRGEDVVALLRMRAAPGAPGEPLLLAYAGAFTMLEAKHGAWPHSRLRAVRAGLRQLDAAVDAAPRDVEIRYLRAVNSWYLPGLFGRRDSASGDLAVLRTLLASDGAAVPALLLAVITDFVEGAR